MTSASKESQIVIRDIDLISEMREVEALQRKVWGCDDRDICPLTVLAATKEVGAILIGAFDRSSLIGFAYSFVGRENNRTIHHSHMLAVAPAQRNLNLGYRLKLAQRERALAQGISRMTWTFDPLQSLNAHFNFAKLGVIADSYKVNFYGETTSSPLHQIGAGTDRLWVTWLLDSQRVRERLETEASSICDLERIPCLVRVGPDNVPETRELAEGVCNKHLRIEIPSDINSVQGERPESAVMWREATRQAFTQAISSGYVVEEFYRANREDHLVGIYLLSHGRKVADFV